MNGSPLKDVLTRVAELYGEQPESVTIRFPSGSKVRIASTNPKADEDDGLTPEERRRFETWTERIVPYMRLKGIPLLRKQIAMGLQIPGNNTQGWFARSVKRLVEKGVLSEDEEGFLTLS
jgi:hypothetical protein